MPTPVSTQAITWAYRLLLDREPENDQVVLDWQARLASLGQLVHEFILSPEFKAKHPTLRYPSLTGHEPAMRINMDLANDDLQRLFLHIQATWQHLGETEPHFSVFTAEQFKQASIKTHQDAFYATGQHEFMRLFACLDRNGIDHTALRSCLDFGCGVGRITRWLCDRFAEVHGCDISQAHLQVAKDYFATQGIMNARFHLLRSLKDMQILPKVDLICSWIVLQHNPPPVIKQIIEHFIRHLNPGGIAFFQVPTYRLGYTFSLDDYLQHEGKSQEMEMHLLPQREIFKIVNSEGATMIEVIEDTLTGIAHSQEMSNTFIVQKK